MHSLFQSRWILSLKQTLFSYKVHPHSLPTLRYLSSSCGSTVEAAVSWTALWKCHILTVFVFVLRGSSHSMNPDQSQGWDQGTPSWAGLAGHSQSVVTWHHRHPLGAAAQCPTVTMGQPLPKDKPFPRKGRRNQIHGSLAKGAQQGAFLTLKRIGHKLCNPGNSQISKTLFDWIWTAGTAGDFWNASYPTLPTSVLDLSGIHVYLPILCSCWDPQATLMIIYLLNPCEAQPVTVQFDTGAGVLVHWCNALCSGSGNVCPVLLELSACKHWVPATQMRCQTRTGLFRGRTGCEQGLCLIQTPLS